MNSNSSESHLIYRRVWPIHRLSLLIQRNNCYVFGLRLAVYSSPHASAAVLLFILNRNHHRLLSLSLKNWMRSNRVAPYTDTAIVDWISIL